MKILFLGNSITLHSRNEEIGWLGEWGMAASAKERDYVHVLCSMLEENGTEVIPLVHNIADFEREPEHFDTEFFTALRDEEPDWIIFKICENSPGEKLDAFGEAYGRLLSWFQGGKKAPKMVCVGAFWKNDKADALMKCAAEEHGIPFVSLAELHSADYQAVGQFAHQGVAAHPSDLGMRRMAELIFKELH